MKIIIPNDVSEILTKLHKEGFEAYAVGGCVRDSILGRVPNDWDITTSALPGEVKNIFRRTVDTGLQHGTVTVLLGNNGYEVTTYRVDGEYTDHRRPDNVTFTSNLEEDLLRRDFTINAMAYNDEEGLVDVFGGMEDIRRKCIRAVGDPDARFDEDALRIMRAVRFSAQLGLEIEEATKEAITRHVDSLKMVSAERIETEFTKLITSPHPEKIEELYNLGITSIFLPEFDRIMETEQRTPYHMYDVGHHTIEVMKAVSPKKYMRYAALLHDIGKPDSKTVETVDREVDGKFFHEIDHFKGHNKVGADMVPGILRRLRMDNDTIHMVKKMVYFHDIGINGISKKGLRRTLSKMGAENYSDLMELKRADTKAQSDYRLDFKESVLEDFDRFHAEIIKEGDALNIKDLAIGGKELIDLGVPRGPKMGEILGRLLDKVLEEPSLNDRDKLLQLAGKMMNE